MPPRPAEPDPALHDINFARGIADGGLPSSASRSARWAACSVAVAPAVPLGGCEVQPVARRAGDCDRDVLLQAAVAGGVVGRAVLPAAPDDGAPGASERADRPLVVVAARSRAGVVVSRPGVPVAGALSERVERAA
jgi:hypothetical protein